MADAVIVHKLGKRFRSYHTHRPRKLKELFIRGPRWLRPTEYFWALRDISFKIPSGCMVGIVGKNGSGKSTLLNLAGDLLRPDEGYINTRGRVGALLDLGAGFHADLTGRENIFANGVITGLTRREVSRCFEAIVDFAELESFVDSPLRTYSTGMRMRLAFAIAVHFQPEILLIDELLAVGDIGFQRKCFERIEQFKKDGCAILFVSHATGQVQEFCDEAIWLHQGQLMAQGEPETVITEYTTAMHKDRWKNSRLDPDNIPHSSENEKIHIAGVRLLDPEGFPLKEINSGDPLRVEIQYLAPVPVTAPNFYVGLIHEDGRICCTTNTATSGITLPEVQGQGNITLSLDRLDLAGGQYYVNVGIYDREWIYTYDYHWQRYPLVVQPTPGNKKGIIHPPHSWQVGPTQPFPTEQLLMVDQATR